MPSNLDIKYIESLLLRAGDLAQAEILKYWNSSFSVEWKVDSTPVTIADKKAEEAVREFALKETPEWGFIGEEFGENINNKQSEYQWVIDPIDGTKAFIHTVPLFGTLIAIVHKGVSIAGLIQLPALNSKIWAIKGGGAFRDGKRIFTSNTAKLADSLVLSGTINTMEDKGYGDWFSKLRKGAQLYRGWGDCYGYYLVACGRAEIMSDPVVSLWDIAPYPVIFSEAGGKFSTLAGETSLFFTEGSPLEGLPLHHIYEDYSSIASNGKFEVFLPSPPI
ncbi:histidinol phosphate phosphatase [Fibrobacterales bacterium]|nr:histidinol phosphate phosphatase [Fibrobacterales bacterium]